MKAITLRNLPPKLAEVLQQESTATGLSLNRTVIRLLEKGADLDPAPRKPRVYHDLDHLAGSWSEDEEAQFAAELARQRQIDPEPWR
jgi:hypothetical protein